MHMCHMRNVQNFVLSVSFCVLLHTTYYLSLVSHQQVLVPLMFIIPTYRAGEGTGYYHREMPPENSPPFINTSWMYAHDLL